MDKVTFINSLGQEINFEKKFPYLLQTIDGAGGVDVNLESQKSPYQDGDTHLNSYLEPRIVDCQVMLKAVDERALFEMRAHITKILNPKLGIGLLRYEQSGGIKEIKATIQQPPIFPKGKGNRGYDYQVTIFSLKCPNPYWLNETDYVDELAVFEGGLSFPLSLPTIFSKQSESKSKIINNVGHVSTPLLVTFTGPATAPIRITNETTGEFVGVNQDLLSGEKLVINTEFGKKKVVKVDGQGNEINAFHYINLQSSFFQLIQGNNLLSYSTGADYERAPVVITWRNRYVGV